MNGIADLMAGVQAGMQLGQQAFSGGGQVQGFAEGGKTAYADWNWDEWGDYTDGTTPDVTYNAPAPTTTSSGMATTQPVATAPVKVGDAPTTKDWYDLNLMVEGGGNMQVPTFRKSDFAYYEAQGEPTMEVVTGSGGDGGYSTEIRANPNYRPAGYYLTPEARARLGDQWTKENATSIAWGGATDLNNMMGGDSMGQSFSSFFNFGDAAPPQGLTTRPTYDANGNTSGVEYGYFTGGGDNPEWVSWTPTEADRAAADEAFNKFWEQEGIVANVKTADKGGTPVYWVRQGDQLVPVAIGGQFEVNTNNDHTIPALSFAALAGGAAASAYFGGAGAAGLEAGMEAGLEGFAGSGAFDAAAADAFALSDAVYGASQFAYGAIPAEVATAAEIAATTTLGMSSTEAAAAGFVFDAAQGVWVAPTVEVIGSAAPAIGAGEVIAGAGTVAAGTQLINPGTGDPYVPEEGPEAPGDSTDSYRSDDPMDPRNWEQPPPNSGDPYHPGDLPNPDVTIPPPAKTWDEYLKLFGDWALKNPGAALSIGSTVAGLVSDGGSSGGGGSGGGGSGSGWQGPMTKYVAGRTYTPAPEGYRPGFSPEHQYVDYKYATDGTYADGGRVGFAVGGLTWEEEMDTIDSGTGDLGDWGDWGDWGDTGDYVDWTDPYTDNSDYGDVVTMDPITIEGTEPDAGDVVTMDPITIEGTPEGDYDAGYYDDWWVEPDVVMDPITIEGTPEEEPVVVMPPIEINPPPEDDVVVMDPIEIIGTPEDDVVVMDPIEINPPPQEEPVVMDPIEINPPPQEEPPYNGEQEPVAPPYEPPYNGEQEPVAPPYEPPYNPPPYNPPPYVPPPPPYTDPTDPGTTDPVAPPPPAAPPPAAPPPAAPPPAAPPPAPPPSAVLPPPPAPPPTPQQYASIYSNLFGPTSYFAGTNIHDYGYNQGGIVGLATGGFAGTGDVTGQITGGQRSADGTKWEFIDQQGNVLTSMPLADFYALYGQDGSGVGTGTSVNDINGVPLYYSAAAQEARRQEYLNAQAQPQEAQQPNVAVTQAPTNNTTYNVANPRDPATDPSIPRYTAPAYPQVSPPPAPGGGGVAALPSARDALAPYIGPGTPIPPAMTRDPYVASPFRYENKFDNDAYFAAINARGYSEGGMTEGPGDGTSDSIPATIDGQQQAALSTDEFVIPADVVADLGNGSSQAGAQVLYAMMERIRQARHGTTEQPRDIDPAKLLPR